MAVTYEPIASTTLTASATGIAFSGIANTWTDLKIVITGRVVNSEQPYIRFNSDSASNYSYTSLYGNSGSTGSFRNLNVSLIYVAPLSNWSATNPQFASIDIFSYAGSTFKTVLCAGSNNNNTTSGIDRTVGMWRSTSAITRIDIVANGQTFAAGFTATLYGIKAA
jgi:hypothetical protein